MRHRIACGCGWSYETDVEPHGTTYCRNQYLQHLRDGCTAPPEPFARTRRADLLPFCYWLLKDEIGEGHEDEIVDKYLAEVQQT